MGRRISLYLYSGHLKETLRVVSFFISWSSRGKEGQVLGEVRTRACLLTVGSILVGACHLALRHLCGDDALDPTGTRVHGSKTCPLKLSGQFQIALQPPRLLGKGGLTCHVLTTMSQVWATWGENYWGMQVPFSPSLS